MGGAVLALLIASSTRLNARRQHWRGETGVGRPLAEESRGCAGSIDGAINKPFGLLSHRPFAFPKSTHAKASCNIVEAKNYVASLVQWLACNPSKVEARVRFPYDADFSSSHAEFFSGRLLSRLLHLMPLSRAASP